MEEGASYERLAAVKTELTALIASVEPLKECGEVKRQFLAAATEMDKVMVDSLDSSIQ